MPIVRRAILSILFVLACSSESSKGDSQGGQPNPATGGQDDAQHDSGTTTSGGAGDSAGGQSSSDAGSSATASGGVGETAGGQSSANGGSSTTAQGGISGGGVSSAAGGATQGGSSNATGGHPQATGGFSASPGLPSQCSQNAKAGQSQSLSGITLDSGSHFAAITPDELTLIWTVPSSTGVTAFVADRATKSAVWGTPQSIVSVPAADNVVTVTPDGLVIAYVASSDRRSFATASRTDRSSSFQFPDPNSGLDFTVQNTSPELNAGDTYAYPLYGPHLTSFYYAVKAANGDLSWYVAGRFETQGVFTAGAPLSFVSKPAATLALSGVSSDENTLLFVDTGTAQSSWSFYDEATQTFGALASIGQLGYVQPTESCTNLYGGAAAGSITVTPLQ